MWQKKKDDMKDGVLIQTRLSRLVPLGDFRIKNFRLCKYANENLGNHKLIQKKVFSRFFQTLQKTLWGLFPTENERPLNTCNLLIKLSFHIGYGFESTLFQEEEHQPLQLDGEDLAMQQHLHCCM